MIVFTFQNKEVAEQIKNGLYNPVLDKSEFLHDSVNMLKGYNKVLKALRQKNPLMLMDENCIWSFVYNPCIELMNNYIRDNKVLLFLEINPSQAIFSDYDKYTDFVLGNTDNDDFLLSNFNEKLEETCIQCSFTVDSILGVLAIYDISLMY